MEKELNIAAILKEKPKGTKLYSAMIGECFLKELQSSLYPIFVDTKNRGTWHFLKDGKFEEDGEYMLFPSKQMRDWEKFAWKKGDVLTNNCGFICIFKEWASDDYTKFDGRYYYNRDDIGVSRNAETMKYNKVNNNTAHWYIREIEKKLGGTFNTSTLEIEKPQFKDGDIVAYGNSVAICQKFDGDKLSFYVADDDMFGLLYYSDVKSRENFRHTTDSEKQQLFSALEKEGKRWNAETKTLEDLPKKCEFKPLDYILVRDKGHVLPMWQLYQYAHENKNYIYVVGSLYGLDRERMEVLPYNDKTAHLLGTTDDWKGGEE